MLCVCSTVLSEFLCSSPRPHHFVVVGLVCHTCLSVRTFLCKFITVEPRILNRAASQHISARQKQSAASERRSRHDDVRRPSLKATTNGQITIKLNTLMLHPQNTLGLSAGPYLAILEVSSIAFKPYPPKILGLSTKPSSAILGSFLIAFRPHPQTKQRECGERSPGILHNIGSTSSKTSEDGPRWHLRTHPCSYVLVDVKDLSLVRTQNIARMYEDGQGCGLAVALSSPFVLVQGISSEGIMSSFEMPHQMVGRLDV